MNILLKVTMKSSKNPIVCLLAFFFQFMCFVIPKLGSYVTESKNKKKKMRRRRRRRAVAEVLTPLNARGSVGWWQCLHVTSSVSKCLVGLTHCVTEGLVVTSLLLMS